MPVTLPSGTPQAQQPTPRASTAPRIPPQRQFATDRTNMPTKTAPKPDHALVASLLPSISTPKAVLDPEGHMLKKTASLRGEHWAVTTWGHPLVMR